MTTTEYHEERSLLAAAKMHDLGVPTEVVHLLFLVRAALLTETFTEAKALMDPVISWRLAEGYVAAVESLVP
jgi:hypothetical protein